MRLKITFVCVFFSFLLFSQSFYVENKTSKSNIETTISNLGLIGNSFRGNYQAKGWGSLEFPAKSNIEHAFLGGLWIGAIINGGVTAVSTGAVGSANGYSTGASGYEFTAPIGSTLQIKSKLVDDPFYDPKAVSHQDFIGNFTDSNVFVPGSVQRIAGHENPLKVAVRFESYNWNSSSANFFIPLKFIIKNTGKNTLSDVCIGYWTDFVIRNVSQYPPGGTPFFSSGRNGYVDSLALAYEWDGESSVPNAQSYAGLMYLGAKDKNGIVRYPNTTTSANILTNYNTWTFNGADNNFGVPNSDLDKFARLKEGQNQKSTWANTQNLIRQNGNRSNLISAGPFATLNPGDEMEIMFAVVCASTTEDGSKLPSENTTVQMSQFIKNAADARTSYMGEDKNRNGMLDPTEDTNNNNTLDAGEDKNGNGILDLSEDINENGSLDRLIFPEPPATPKTKFIVGDGKVDMYWTNNSVISKDPVTKKLDFEGFKIYRTQLAYDMQANVDVDKSLKLIRSFDNADNNLFFNNGFSEIALPTPITFEGDPNTYYYKYTFNNMANGWQHAVALTAFDTGDSLLKVQSQETSKMENVFRIFPGTPANGSIKTNEPYVYPNPYYGIASWEGKSNFEESKKLIFANLPKRCTIKIYTLAGDLIDQINHDEKYNGSDMASKSPQGWFAVYSDTEKNIFSGGEHAWSLMSANAQIIARGFYIFNVEDTTTGETFVGKFTVIK